MIPKEADQAMFLRFKLFLGIGLALFGLGILLSLLKISTGFTPMFISMIGMCGMFYAGGIANAMAKWESVSQ